MTLGITPPQAIRLGLFETGFHWISGMSDSARVGQARGQHPQFGIPNAHRCVLQFTKVPGPRFLSLCSKHVSHQAISPAAPQVLAQSCHSPRVTTRDTSVRSQRASH